MAGDPKIPKFSCLDGVLSIESPQTSLRLRWSPVPLAEQKIPGSTRWTRFWPAFRLIRPENGTDSRLKAIGELVVPVASDEQAKTKEVAFQEFRSGIPDNLANLAAPFRSHQWQLLSLMQASSAALELAGANPVLCYCLANNSEFRNTKEDAAAVQAVWYSHRKQKLILEWLGFKATESLVRLFRKIPPDAAYPSLMRRLRSMLAHDQQFLAMMAHLPKISRGVLELVTNQETEKLAAAKLLHEVAERNEEISVEQASDILLGALLLRQEMGIKGELRPFTSVAQILRFQEQMDAEYRDFQRRQEEARLAEEMAVAAQARRLREARAQQERKRVDLLHRPFPAPPIPGTEDIVPLMSRAELQQEGSEQRNCVASYASRVVKGQTFIYKVFRPERATLSIVWTSDRCWRRSELKKAGNAAVRPETVNVVEQWLNQHRVSI